MDVTIPYPVEELEAEHVEEAQTVKIWAWCPNCWTQTYQAFEREDSKYEHYRCEGCGLVHSIAVR